MQFFNDNYPCWFEGCEDLRRAYKEELAQQTNCKTCTRGTLIRKYSEKVKPHVTAPAAD
jgi:hypothetical protein